MQARSPDADDPGDRTDAILVPKSLRTPEPDLGLHPAADGEPFSGHGEEDGPDADAEDDLPSPQVLSVGMAPGSLSVPAGAQPTTITVIRWAGSRIEQFDRLPHHRLLPLLEGFEGVTWVDVTGCGTIEVFEYLAKECGVPWLALEDVLNAPQRPKLEPFGDARFLIVRQIQEPGTVEMDQISLWISGRVVITFQHHHGDCFGLIRRRLADPSSQLRQRGADYLAYRIVDACVDSFFPEAERLMDSLEELEASAVGNPDRSALLRLHELKRQLRTLEKTILPLRDAVGSLTRDDAVFAADTRPYVRDVHDHTNQLVEQAHLLDQLAGDVGDLALGALDVRLNAVMKVLAAVTSIFMPLSFITSYYGMNFKHMPELEWPWAYPALLGLILLSTALMVLWLRRRGWTKIDS